MYHTQTRVRMKRGRYGMERLPLFILDPSVVSVKKKGAKTEQFGKTDTSELVSSP